MSVRHSDQSPHRGRRTIEFQAIGALLLIALGAVFLVQKAGYMSESANWWVIFLFFPGIGLLWNAVSDYRRDGEVSSVEVIEVVLGVILLLLTVIFIFDPNWSFTKDWNIGRIFPNTNWDRIWPFAVGILGILLLVAGIIRKLTGVAVLGAAMTVVAVVEQFNINWDYVWPLAIVAAGLWLLYKSTLRRTE